MWLLMTLPLFALAEPWTVQAVPNPQVEHRGWVSDQADILSEAQESSLEATLQALHDDLGAEVVVVTLGDVDAATPKDFATRLFNAWGIGDEQANNGLLVLMVMDRRRLEMETGYGLEGVLPDGWLGGMQADHMVPAFKRGDFGAGMVAGIGAVDARMRAYPERVREGSRGAIPVADDYDDYGTYDEGDTSVRDAVIGGSALGGCTLLGVGGLLFYRRRQRTCPDCKEYMPRLDEEADDAHLDAGQRTEEAIGSINWHVHVCPSCAKVRTFRGVQILSGHSSCPQCGNRTRTTSSKTLSSATRYSTGLREISERCAHCSYSQTYTRVIPKLPDPPPPSSSSSSGGGSWGGGGGSSGGGSFGGGSSGGGGAGSSW